jgi:diguanylate cyclase (GGDEF)-like protein/PAS domain S-box-containing protein
MIVNFKRSSFQNFAILLSAVLLGATLGPIVLPLELVRKLHVRLGFGLTYAFAILATMGFVLGVLAFLKKASARHMQLDQELLEAFLEHIPDNVFFKDRRSRFLRISRSMADHFGLKSPKLALNKTDADIFSNEHAGQALIDELEIIRTGLPIIQKEEKETWPDGRETWALTTKLPLRGRDGQIIGTMGISHNITSQKEAEGRVRHLTLHDALTGLPNRLLLEDRLAQAVASSKRRGDTLAVFSINLDRFKNVNDSLGHQAGDRVLEAIAERLKSFTRASDTIARSGGDEFVLACSGISDSAQIDTIATKVASIFSTPFLVDQEQTHLTASIGIAQFPENGETPEALLQASNAAMYEAKKKGRGRVNAYSAALTAETRRQNELEADLLEAFSRDEFVIHYQPFIDSRSGQITGMEALLRWKHPRLGLIPPDRFIPQLEELGKMNEVGGWVLRTACGQTKEWNRRYHPPVRVAVNVSSQQFYEGNIIDAVESALRNSQLEAEYLELELTESRILDDSEATLAIMRHLKQIGVSLSLDDFGTGWSSLSYLRRFPLDRIKVDRSFVRDIATQPDARAMVKSILALSQGLGLSNIAEGVETIEQRDLLRGLGCPEMQGYYFSRPLLPSDAAALLCTSKLQSKEGVRNARVGTCAAIRSPAAASRLDAL